MSRKTYGMGETQKGFWYGSVATAVIYPIVILVAGWFGLRAIEVPVMQERMEAFNTNLGKLNITLNTIHSFIEDHHKDRMEWIGWKNEIIVRLDNVDADLEDIKVAKKTVMAHIEHERERGQY